MNREKESAKLAEKLQDRLIALESKLEKCVNLLSEERKARKRAEQEYDWVIANTQKQDKIPKQKNIHEQMQPKEVSEKSPTRKKPCSRTATNNLDKEITRLDHNKSNIIPL